MTHIGRLPDPTQDVWEWQLHAACRGMDSSMFFHPWGERGPTREQRIELAKAVCAGCPVSDACRRHALSVQEPYGVWGGLSEDDRLVLLGRQRHSHTPRDVLGKPGDPKSSALGG